MSKFFQKVATPETQFRQQQAPSGPDVDVNARAEIMNEQRTSLGAAVNDLLGIAQAGASALAQADKAETQILEAEHSIDADGDVEGSASFIKSEISNSGKPIEDYTRKDLKKATDEATKKYIEKHKLGEKKYFKIIKDRLDKKNSLFINKQAAENKEIIKDKRYKTWVKQAMTIFATANEKELENTLNKHFNDNIGTEPREVNGKMVEPPIEDTRENAEMRFAQGVMESIIASRDYKALSKLRKVASKFGIPKEALDVMQQKTQAKQNAVRQMNRDNLEEEVYLGIQNRAFSSPKQVDAWFNDKLKEFPKEDRPDTKDILKLKADAMGDMENAITLRGLKDAVLNGDSTAIDRAPIKKALKDQAKNELFLDVVDINDTSVGTLESAIISGDREAEMKTYFSKVGQVPPFLKLYGSTPPSGGIDALKKRRLVFAEMARYTEGTNVSINNIYNPEERTRIEYVSRLLDDAEDGVLTEEEVTQAYRNFNNDVKKNTDSRGVYISPKAASVLSDVKVTEWLGENVTDAFLTIDEFSAQDYRRRQFTHYFSLAMENTESPDVAMERAEEMFKARHKEIEAPNGEEVTIPEEYMDYEKKDWEKIAQYHPAFDAFRTIGYIKGLGSETYFKRSISMTPDDNYERNKIMHITHGEGINKVKVLSLDPKKMADILEKIDSNIVEKAKKRRKERLEKARLKAKGRR